MGKVDYAARTRILNAIYEYQNREFGKRFHMSEKRLDDIREGRREPTAREKQAIDRSFRYYKNETGYTYVVANEYLGKGKHGDYFTFGHEEFATSMSGFEDEFESRLDKAVEAIANEYPDYSGEVEVRTIVTRVKR